MQKLLPISACLALVVGFGSCAETGAERHDIAATLELADTAYAAALRVSLTEPQPLDIPGLHNVFRLSPQIFSGAEPHDEAGFVALAELGVATILSVDGKTPDAEAAAAHGMRYVHVPIRYRGISDGELLRIAKTFRELPGPFYVHCFHGRHRGPAAAAVGRLVLDGTSRERALAEMRQWCGTSAKYEGLYRSIAVAPIPDASTTAAFAWDFPAAHPFAGFRELMIQVSRAFDRLAAMARNDWRAPSEHPDIDPLNEALILANLFERAESLDEVQRRPDDFREWIRLAGTRSLALRDTLSAIQRSGGIDWTPADDAYGAVKDICSACHQAYRND